jgi:hypothetical protein
MRSALAAWVIGVAAALLAPHARAETWPITRGLGALPGIHRVITAEPFTTREVSLLSSAGVGLSSGVVCARDAHERTTAAMAASLSVHEWLALSLRLDGRYDRLSSCMSEDLSSWNAAGARLGARARVALAPAWHAAGRVQVGLPTDRGLSVDPTAITIDALAALSHEIPARLRIGANLGFRLDRSGELGDRYVMPTRAERISLGVSESHAILMGMGAACRLGRAELLAEWTWDWHIGGNAPDVRVSPMRVAAGARMGLSPSLAVQFTMEASLADTPTGLPPDPLSPFESRVTVLVGLHYRGRVPVRLWPSFRRSQPGLTSPEPIEPEAPIIDDQPKPELAALGGRVVDAGGAGVAGAEVEVEITLHGQTRKALTDADGRFEIPGLPAGPVDLRVSAQGFHPAQSGAELEAGQTRAIDITLTPKAQLRGLVRSFRGTPLQATLTLEPQDGQGTPRTVLTRPDGSFEIDVEPGRYRVEINAQGYLEQSRRVKVEDSGVTIINVDMRKR